MLLREDLWCEDCQKRTFIDITDELLYVCSECQLPYPLVERDIKANMDIQKDNNKHRRVNA